MIQNAEKKHHCYSFAAGCSEFVMVASLHTLVPISVTIGHLINLIAFTIYVFVMIASLNHSLNMIKSHEKTK